jgi:hypothetical protein
MKIGFRKTIAVLLTIAMAFSLCSVVSFAATAEDVWQYGTYTSLGDSAVAGYGLPGWEKMKQEYAVWGEDAVDMDVRDTIAYLNSLQSEENAIVEGTPEYAATFAVLKQQKLEELGDDLANYWHATDFTRLHEVEGTYASLIAKAVGASEAEGTFHPYAQCAFRTEELLMVLDKNYKGDSKELIDISASMSNGSFSYENLLELQSSELYPEAIRNSNLVTMSIGANDIYVPILGTIMADLVKLMVEQAAAQGEQITEEEAMADAAQAVAENDTEVFEQAAEYADQVELGEATEAEQAEAVEALNDAGGDTGDVDTNDEASALQAIAALMAVISMKDPLYPAKIANLALKCEVNYRINYPKIVKRIFEINPNVTLVVPSYTLNYDGFGNLGGILKLVFGEMNLFVKLQPNHNGRYIPVTLPDKDLVFVDNSHPDVPSHALIAETILKALPVQTAFDDVAGLSEEFKTAINWAVQQGVTEGTSPTTFSPNEKCTRAQIVTFLWRMAGKPAPTQAAAFTDLTEDWYADAVAWASENGVTNGTSADKFSPDQTCTRAQIVTFLYRYDQKFNPDAKSSVFGGTSFRDVSAGAYYGAPVTWAVKNGITKGVSTVLFAPLESCTRVQAVTFLYRYAAL